MYSKLDELNTNPNNNTINHQQQQPSIDIQNQNEISIQKSIHIDYELSFLIDMKKFIQALTHKIQIDDNKLWFVFREIRLRIFRRPDLALKHLTLYSIFYYDLFGTLSKTSNLLQSLLLNQTLQLEVMKLINSLASLNKGRNYLLAKDTLIDEIVQIMIRENNDTDLRQNCLGSLQKFTLRAAPQNRLIELNVIHYIVDVFTYEANNLSDYTVEYGLALIMTLSLKQAGREKFEAVAERILQILLNFMNKGDGQVLTCINGTLYSLLKRQKFKKEAKKFNLENILQNYQTDNPQVKKQILYILEELNNPPEEKVYDENFEDDSGARDEDELAYDEEMDGDSINEELFEEHYQCLGEFIIRNANMNDLEIQRLNKFMTNNPNMCGNIQKSTLNSVSSLVRPEDADRPLRRPTTPMTTNLSMTGNSQMFYHGDKRALRNTNTLGSGNGNNNGIVSGDTGMLPKIGTDTAGAFQTKDKLKRTIPIGLNNNNIGN